MKKIIVFVLLCCSMLSLTTCGKTPVDESIYDIGMSSEFPDGNGLPDGGNEKVSVIFLLGQSNCTGCSITSYLKEQANPEDFARYEKGYEDIRICFDIDNHRNVSEGEFRKTDLLCGSYDEEFGPEVGIGDTLSKELPGKKVFILKYSMSGYSLNWHWLRHKERGEIYNSFRVFAIKYLDYLKSMNYDISLDAICWMQGESDTSKENAKLYYDNQVAFMRYLREDFSEYNQTGGIHFVDAGISDSPYCLPGYPTVNEAKKKIADSSELNHYFSTIDHGLTTMNEPYYEPDLGHYDALDMIRLGELFGDELVKILKEGTYHD